MPRHCFDCGNEVTTVAGLVSQFHHEVAGTVWVEILRIYCPACIGKRGRPLDGLRAA